MTTAASPPLAELAVLRSISARITPPKTQRELSELPHIVASQVRNLRDCGSTLSQSWTSQSGSSKGEAALVVHRLVTHISSLLSGRNPGERWAAAVLIKAVLEAGGHEMLSRGKHWVSGLLTNLRKSDPSSSRAIYVLTLTRLFMLTWPFPSLVREITTPNLSHLIKTCLSNISSNTANDRERRTILECFLKLLPHHPTVFRAHASDLQHITGTILGISDESKPSPELAILPEATRLVAIQLRTALHGCAPKQGSTASWEEGISSQISKCHKLADTVFASVATDSGSNASQRVKPTEYSSAVDQLELSMNILASYIRSESPAPVTLPVKTLHELGSRILTVVVSDDGKLPRFKDGTLREDKDMVSTALPRLHIAALQVIDALVSRSNLSGVALSSVLLEQVAWLFHNESTSADIRTAVYMLTSRIMSTLRFSFGRKQLERITTILKTCCDDILPKEQLSESVTLATKLTNGSKQQSGTSSDQVSLSAAPQTSTDGLRVAAIELLELALGSLPTSAFSDALRSQLDRTAILSGLPRLVIASTLNASRRKAGRPGLLPFLANMNTHEPAVEALLRPRAPVIEIVYSGKDVQTTNGATSHEGDYIDVAPVSEDTSSTSRKRDLDEDTEAAGNADESNKRTKQTTSDDLDGLTDTPSMQTDTDMGAEIITEPPVVISSALQTAESEATIEQHVTPVASHIAPAAAASYQPQDLDESDDDEMEIKLDLDDSEDEE